MGGTDPPPQEICSDAIPLRPPSPRSRVQPSGGDALHDIADIRPLMQALLRLLKPTDRFVFSVPHPGFNFPLGSMVALEEGRDGDVVGLCATSRWLTTCTFPREECGHVGGARPPLFPPPTARAPRRLLPVRVRARRAGEPAFGPEDEAGRPLDWANFTDIPPILVAHPRPTGWWPGRNEEYADAGAD